MSVIQCIKKLPIHIWLLLLTGAISASIAYFASNSSTATSSPPSSGKSGLKVNEHITVTRLEYGEYIGDSLIPSISIPLKKGILYGWEMDYKSDLPDVEFSEELILPSAAKEWNSERPASTQFDVNQGKTSATTRWKQKTDSGTASSIWEVNEGDPSGKYLMRISMNGQRVADLELFLMKSGTVLIKQDM